MALTNNTKYRRITLTINKKLNGSLVTTNGFPKVHNITDAFGAYPSINQQVLETLTEGAYNTRLNDFYAHLEGLYSFFDRNFVLNPANGTDAVLCPLDNTPPAQIEVLSWGAGLEPLQGGTLDNYLTWGITLSGPVSADTPYEFSVLLRDKFGNPIRYEICYGIIKAGQSMHNSLDDNNYIYIPEADNPMFSPIMSENDPNSLII